jgi:hypothetical protein
VSVRSCRWLLFLVFALTVPVPMVWVPFDAFEPAVGYAILFAASAAVALAEGTAGPVPGILLLAGAHALAAAGLTGLAAWIAGRVLAPLAPRTRRFAALGACAALLVLALGVEIYRTPFGRAPVGNLLDVLW